MGEYTDYPADYAEVSSFKSGQQSPAPYATTTLIGSSKLGANDAHRYNMFYTTDIYPPNSASAGGAVPNQGINNNNYNRSIHSESYCNPNGNNNKMNIVENRMASTMMPNMFHQQQQQRNGGKIGSNKRNRLKLMKPHNFRLNFGSQGEQLYVKVGDINGQGQASSTGQQTPSSQNGSINWSQQNFNIYENHLHNQTNGGTMNDPDKDYNYSGNRSVMSYMSSKDFPENV